MFRNILRGELIIIKGFQDLSFHSLCWVCLISILKIYLYLERKHSKHQFFRYLLTLRSGMSDRQSTWKEYSMWLATLAYVTVWYMDMDSSVNKNNITSTAFLYNYHMHDHVMEWTRSVATKRWSGLKVYFLTHMTKKTLM